MPYRASISRIDGPEPAVLLGRRGSERLFTRRGAAALAVVMAPRRRGDAEVVAITTGAAASRAAQCAPGDRRTPAFSGSVAAGADPTTGLSVAGGGATCPEARQWWMMGEVCRRPSMNMKETRWVASHSRVTTPRATAAADGKRERESGQ